TVTITVNENQAPVADAGPDQTAFTGETVTLNGSGSTDDGSIQSYVWDFGDGATASGVTVSHVYTTADTYTVSLTVTDNSGLTASDTAVITVSQASDMALSVTGFKAKGLQKADLEWSGAVSTNVDIYRDGSIIATAPNDGFYRDNINNRGGGTYVYKVCESDSSVCSNEASVSF
ncbi:MAG: PKD domain-containing protein, partial [Candidatus Yanofskybacteria bacterium]|nr:PKD domain-containing protein [Candidatus Yanofskybacteria bacterium]